MLNRTSPSAIASVWPPLLLLALAALVVSSLYAALAVTSRGGLLHAIPPVFGAVIAAAAWWTAQDQARGLRWLAAAAVAVFLATAIVQMPPALLVMALAALGAVVVVAGLRAAGGLPDARTATAVLAAAALALVPFRGLGEIPLGASVLGLSDFALGAALVVWLGGRGRGSRTVMPPLALAVALFAAWLGVTGVLAYNLAPVLKETTKWLQVAVAVVVLADVLRHPDARLAVVWMVGIAVAAEAVVGLVQAITGLGPAAFNVGGLIRSYGTFEQPNPFGGYLGLHLPLLLAGAIYARRSRRPWITVLWLLVLAAVVISRSRGAWIGMIGSTAVVLLAAMPRARVLGVAAGALLIAGFLAFAGWQFSGGVVEVIPDPARAAVAGRVEPRDALRMVVGDDYPVSERLAQWEIGWRMFMSAPLIGVGAGNYDDAYPGFAFTPFRQPPGHAHNIYLNFAAETGLPGAVAFLALSAWAIWRCICAVQWSRGTRWEWASIGALGGLVAFTLHNLVDSLFVNGMGLVFALFIALSYAVEWDRRRQACRAAEAPS